MLDKILFDIIYFMATRRSIPEVSEESLQSTNPDVYVNAYRGQMGYRDRSIYFMSYRGRISIQFRLFDWFRAQHNMNRLLKAHPDVATLSKRPNR